MRGRIVPVEPSHVAHVAAVMRQADRDEVAAWGGWTPAGALRQSMANSRLAWTGLLDGVPLCIFGAATADRAGPVAAPWMLGTDRMGDAPHIVARMARAVVAGLHQGYPLLANWTDTRHTGAHALIRWLGFTIGPAEPRGVDGALFRPFWRTVEAA